MSTLDDLYAALPALACKGLCSDSCYSVGATEAETVTIELRHGVKVETGFYPDGCPALSPFKRCSVYVDRPLICRLWGMVPSMACSHGCVPVGGLLSEEAGRELVRQALDH